MKKTKILLPTLLFSSFAFAHQIKINIHYPVKGDIYPKVFLYLKEKPQKKIFPIDFAYIPFGFSVTCKGDHRVSWRIDKYRLGNEKFYDMFDLFWVKSDCGKNRVEFYVK